MNNDDSRVPSNQAIIDRIDALQSGQEELRTELARHRREVSERMQAFVATDQLAGITRQITTDVVRQVSGTFRNITEDAIRTVAAEIQTNAQKTAHDDFRQWYAEQRKNEREERRKDIIEALGAPRRFAGYVQPLFQFIVTASLVWVLFHRLLARWL